MVCGATVPCSLGINPALTIATLAERAVQQWGLAGGWLADWHHPTVAPAAASSPPIGPELTPETDAKPTLRPRFFDPPQAAPQQPTEVQVIEQMQGRVFLQHDSLASAGHTLQLTLSFEPQAVQQLMHPQASQRRLHLRPERGQLKLLGPKGAVLLTAQVSGTVHLFGLEPSGYRQRQFRAARAWWLNRGLRDIAQGGVRLLRQPLGDVVGHGAAAHAVGNGPAATGLPVGAYASQLWALFSHAGRVSRSACPASWLACHPRRLTGCR